MYATINCNLRWFDPPVIVWSRYSRWTAVVPIWPHNNVGGKPCTNDLRRWSVCKVPKGMLKPCDICKGWHSLWPKHLLKWFAQGLVVTSIASNPLNRVRVNSEDSNDCKAANLVRRRATPRIFPMRKPLQMTNFSFSATSQYQGFSHSRTHWIWPNIHGRPPTF